MNLVIGNEDTTGERKTNIRAPLQCRGQCELFSILMHYVCIRERDEFSPSSTWAYVRVLDLANSDLHFPCTPCEMFSDVGTVTAIIYKVVHPPSTSTSNPFLSYVYLHLEEWGIGNMAVITNQGREMEIHT